ncbi:MAG: APC family permease [Armatimonadota bacterium]
MRRLLIGEPLATHRMSVERLGVLGGLAVFAADALSSTAYGTEEILRALILAGSEALPWVVSIGAAVVALLAIVVTSYRQTVVEYPSGGGAYVVARDNLGTMPSLVAGAALQTDYVLTVAVSVAAGVAAITSAWPVLFEHRVAIGVVWVMFMALVNLRGVRESAAVFGVPVYAFIGLMFTLIIVGLGRLALGTIEPVSAEYVAGTQPLTLFLILRAFSSGGATLTGVEAVANGVQAFTQPSGRNAARVLGLLGTLLAIMFLGITLLAHGLRIQPAEQETVISQIASAVFGRSGLYYALQLATATILVIAANTSFAGFPRLAAFMANDGFVPRQFANLGDRLVYSNGIVFLALLSALLLAIFGGEVHALIPLYAVGVFTAFTLSQWGMVLHWRAKRDQGWRRRAIVNGIGGSVTGIVMLVVAVSKFVLGAWIVVILIPAMLLVFRAIRHHYNYVAQRLSLDQASEVKPLRNLNLLLVGGMHRGTLEGLEYLRALTGEGRAVHVEVGGEATPRIQRLWSKWEQDIPLTVLRSPYRSMTEPLVEYIRKAQQDEGYDVVTVIIPEFVVNTFWESLLHNHSALWLQVTLRNVPGVAVLNMRYRL